MDEALRQEGLDERKMAQILGGVVGRTEGKKATARVDEKLLVDVVKECNRHLDSPHPASPAPASAASGTSVIVNLIHQVARPVRVNAATTVASADPVPPTAVAKE